MGVNGVDWCTEGVSGPYGVRSLEIHKTGVIAFSLFIQFEAGNVTRVKFWHDLWCGDCPLREAFQELI